MSRKQQIKQSTPLPMKKLAMAVAIVLGSSLTAIPGTAIAGDFNDLCGKTIITDVTLKNIDDTVTSNCTIVIGNGASLTIKDDSVIDFKDYNLNVYGRDSGSFTVKESDLDFSDGYLYVSTYDGDISFIVSERNTATYAVDMENDKIQLRAWGVGSVTVKGFDFNDASGISLRAEDGGDVVVLNSHLDIDSTSHISLYADSGDVIAKDSHFDIYSDTSLNLKTNTGDIIVKDNTGENFENSSSAINIRSYEGDITVKDNVIPLIGRVDIRSDHGDVTIKDNDFNGSNNNTWEAGGDCTATDNTPDDPCNTI